jgi:hypothetical protein
VRETFEETGVMLCTPGFDLSDARTEVEAGRVGFGDLLREHGLRVDAAALRPWSRWITPPGEVRRYDAHFFVAALPDGGHAQDLTTESSSADWITPAAALGEFECGERGLLPPTVATLSSLAPFASVAEVLDAAASRPTQAICPEIRRDGERVVAQLPDGETIEVPKALFS